MVNRFNEQRENKGITIERLSEITGISEKELFRIESPDYDIEKMPAVKAAYIAKALGCMVSDLIYKR